MSNSIRMIGRARTNAMLGVGRILLVAATLSFQASLAAHAQDMSAMIASTERANGELAASLEDWRGRYQSLTRGMSDPTCDCNVDLGPCKPGIGLNCPSSDDLEQMSG